MLQHSPCPVGSSTNPQTAVHDYVCARITFIGGLVRSHNLAKHNVVIPVEEKDQIVQQRPPFNDDGSALVANVEDNSMQCAFTLFDRTTEDLYLCDGYKVEKVDISKGFIQFLQENDLMSFLYKFADIEVQRARATDEWKNWRILSDGGVSFNCFHSSKLSPNPSQKNNLKLLCCSWRDADAFIKDNNGSCVLRSEPDDHPFHFVLGVVKDRNCSLGEYVTLLLKFEPELKRVMYCGRNFRKLVISPGDHEGDGSKGTGLGANDQASSSDVAKPASPLDIGVSAARTAATAAVVVEKLVTQQGNVLVFELLEVCRDLISQFQETLVPYATTRESFALMFLANFVKESTQITLDDEKWNAEEDELSEDDWEDWEFLHQREREFWHLRNCLRDALLLCYKGKFVYL